ncbi:MAG: hypothetical protein MZV49_18665 [Rhodopseudomonas palustris]|nr:hypothetical protein [Rhodopseudomonas palustris]
MNEAMQVIERRVAAFNANTDRFEGAISEVIETVSSASGNMGTTAGSLGRGATATRERANAVSAASRSGRRQHGDGGRRHRRIVRRRP